jgi:hypothetical protein
MTSFSTASGSIGGELALCQRYYYRANSAGSVYTVFGLGYADSATTCIVAVPVPAYMRVYPTSFDFANMAFQDAPGAIFPASGIAGGGGSGATAANNNITFQMTGMTGLTVSRPGRFLSNGVTNAHIGFSAEI